MKMNVSFFYGCFAFFCLSSAYADDVKSCNATQASNCAKFCVSHQGVQSCMLDITTQSGQCVCVDGTSRSKKK